MTRNRKTDLAFAAGLALMVLFVFSRTLGGGFLNWDDPVNVTKNPLVQSLSVDSLRSIFSDFETAARYKPLAWLGWAVIHAVYGLEPVGYHLANVLLHAANSVLLFLILLRLTRMTFEGDDRTRIAAALGTLFWAVHPLRVEPVAWVTGFPYGLSICFMLVAFWAYLRLDFGRPAWGQGDYWLAVTAYLLATLTYPAVLSFVAALIAVDCVPLSRFRRGDEWSFLDPSARRVWLEKLPFLLIAGVAIGGTVFGVKHLSGEWFDEWQLGKATLLSKVMQSLYMEAVYLWRTVAPTNLSPVYFDLFEISGREPHLIGGSLVTVVVTWAAFSEARRRPGRAALWLTHLGLMVPFLGVTAYPHYPSDRYSILAGMVFGAALSLFLAARPEGSRFRSAATIAGLSVLLAGGLAFNRSRVWMNDDVFFADMEARLPDGPHRSRAFFLHGESLQSRGDHPAAIRLFENSWRVAAGEPPEELPFHHGLSLLHLGRFADAIEQFELARRMQRDTPAIRGNIGFALMQLGRFAEAESVFSDLVRQHPGNALDRVNLGIIQLELGRPREALAQLESARAAAPQIPAILHHLARAHRALGDESAATRCEAELRRLTE